MVSLNDIVEIIQSHSSFIISTHKHSDGDGLGAGTALHYILESLNKKSKMITVDSIHKKYNYLNKDNAIEIFDENKILDLKPEVLIIVDTNNSELVDPLYSFAKKNKIKVCFLDHHILQNYDPEDIMFVDSQASSTAEIIYTLLKELNCSMSEDIAIALYTSILFDTNQFRNIKNSPSSFTISSELIPHIKDVNSIYDHLFKNLTIDNLNFFKTVDKIKYFANDTIAFLYLTEEYIEDCNTDINQAYDLMDIVLDIATIQHTALVVKKKDNSFKISLRSKNVNLVPLAEKFGGGGHKHSAGAYLETGSIEEIQNTIVSYFKS